MVEGHNIFEELEQATVSTFQPNVLLEELNNMPIGSPEFLQSLDQNLERINGLIDIKNLLPNLDIIFDEVLQEFVTAAEAQGEPSQPGNFSPGNTGFSGGSDGGSGGGGGDYSGDYSGYANVSDTGGDSGGGSDSSDSSNYVMDPGDTDVSDVSAPVPNLPDVASGNPNSVMGNELLTDSQQQFVAQLAKKTGLDPNVIAAWVLNEHGGDFARNREAEGNHNWLNIGYTDSGQMGTGNPAWHGDPIKAADATAAWMKGEYSAPGFGKAAPGITEILQSAGKSPAEQIAALQNSPWASSHYPNLPGMYEDIVAANVSSLSDDPAIAA